MNAFLKNVGKILPGIVILGIITWLSGLVSTYIGVNLMGFKKTPISSVMVALIIGLVMGNVIKIPKYFDAGFQYGSKKILRYGIVLLGLRLSLLQIGGVAFSMLPVIFACVLVGLFLPHLFNKWLKLPPELVMLISVGTSICGISAIVATSESISAKKEYTAYAIATITIFGLLGMLVYPFLANFIFASKSFPIGLFLGTAIHDTSQVTGAAFIYQDYFNDSTVVEVATIAKLIRNTMMAFVIPGITLFNAKRVVKDNTGETNTVRKTSFRSLFPFFVLGFIFMAALRTVGDQVFKANGLTLIGFDTNSWAFFIDSLLKISSILITMALAAVGLKTSIAIFKGLGLKPFFMGLITAIIVGVTSVVGNYLLLI